MDVERAVLLGGVPRRTVVADLWVLQRCDTVEQYLVVEGGGSATRHIVATEIEPDIDIERRREFLRELVRHLVAEHDRAHIRDRWIALDHRCGGNEVHRAVLRPDV